MDWDLLRDWLDNPIFIKHVRSRLRWQHFGASMTVVLVLCICIAWGGYQLDGFANGGAFGVLLGLQAVVLVVMGASQVGSSVGAARASRHSRLPPCLAPDAGRADHRLLLRCRSANIFSSRARSPSRYCAWRLGLRAFTGSCS